MGWVAKKSDTRRFWVLTTALNKVCSNLDNQKMGLPIPVEASSSDTIVKTVPKNNTIDTAATVLTRPIVRRKSGKNRAEPRRPPSNIS